jgi:hypothetical protein
MMMMMMMTMKNKKDRCSCWWKFPNLLVSQVSQLVMLAERKKAQ